MASTTTSETTKSNLNKNKKTSSSSSKKPRMTKEERRVKYTNIARERRQKQGMKKKHSNTICYSCRRKGHAVSDCPYNNNHSGGDNNDEGERKMKTTEKNKVSTSSASTSICYKCGKSNHSLKHCPLLTKEEKQQAEQNNGKLNYHKMNLPFATCFICKHQGHLSSQCQLNTHGIYVNAATGGGCCKFCGKNDHLFIHCTERGNGKRQRNDRDDDSDGGSAGNVEEFLEGDDNKETTGGNPEQMTTNANPSGRSTSKKKKKVVQF